MKTKHISTVLLWGWVLALGASMFSCSSDDDEVIGDDSEVIDDEVVGYLVFYLRGDHYGYKETYYVPDITGVLCVDPPIDGISVQNLYVEEATTKDRYYLPDLHSNDPLYAAFTDVADNGVYISKGINVLLDAEVCITEVNPKWSDWSELMEQGIQINGVGIVSLQITDN